MIKSFSSFKRKLSVEYKNIIVTEISSISNEDSVIVTEGYLKRFKEFLGFTIIPRRAHEIVPSCAASGDIMGLLKYNEETVGLIIAKENNFHALNEKILYQTYYCSTLFGIKAVHAAIAAHRFLIEYAKNLGYDAVVSSGRPGREGERFTRVLSMDGWQKIDQYVIKRLSWEYGK